MIQVRHLVPTVLAVLAISTIACTSTENEKFNKITPSEQIFSIEDFKAIRFKINTEYDVSKLPSSSSAWFGFWTPEGTVAKEYELRFYRSHEDAIKHGTSYAVEGSGDTALLDEEDAKWDEGLKDRRAFFAGQVGTHGSGSVQPLYGGYATYGNIILLCEGENESQALDYCAALMNAVDPQSRVH